MVQISLISLQEFPTQTKYSFGIACFPLRRALRIFKNIPQGQEGIFLG